MDDANRVQKDLEDFFENGVVALHWVAADGRILRANQAELDMLGYRRDEYVGRDIREFHADPATIQDILERLSRGEQLRNYEARLRAKDGSSRDVLISSSVQFRDGAFANTRCFTIDVTDRKRAEAALRENEQRLRATYEGAFAGIAEVDLQGRFLRLNARFCELTGYAGPELVGRSFLDITHRDDRGRDWEQFRRLLSGEIDTYKAEKRFVRRDGGTVWAELSASIVRDAAGRPLYGVRVVQDITELKDAEQRQLTLMAELDHRVKNTLAVIQSVVGLTKPQALSVETFAESLEGRIRAMARTHELLTKGHWAGASLRSLVEAEVQAYRTGENIATSGPDLMVRPRTASIVSMALHELATNAVKHGAWSLPSGRVNVSWALDDLGEGKRGVRLRWTERGGPRVSPPERTGFGLRLLQRGLSFDPKGEVQLSFEPAGVTCVMAFPLQPSDTAAAEPGSNEAMQENPSGRAAPTMTASSGRMS